MSQRQYLRKCNLIVSNAKGNGLDISDLKITFDIKKSDAENPNTATIRV